MEKQWEQLQKQIAEKNGVSCDCVEKELVKLIDTLWDSPTAQAKGWLLEAGWGKKPTPFQVIIYLSRWKTTQTESQG